MGKRSAPVGDTCPGSFSRLARRSLSLDIQLVSATWSKNAGPHLESKDCAGQKDNERQKSEPGSAPEV